MEAEGGCQDSDSDDDPWYEGAAYLVYRAQCCEEYTRNRAVDPVQEVRRSA